MYVLRSLLSVENDYRRRAEVEAILQSKSKTMVGLTRLVAVPERKAHRFTALR